MKKEFLERVAREGIVDTEKFRYIAKENLQNGCYDILKIDKDELDTTAAYDEWEKVGEAR